MAKSMSCLVLQQYSQGVDCIVVVYSNVIYFNNVKYNTREGTSWDLLQED